MKQVGEEEFVVMRGSYQYIGADGKLFFLFIKQIPVHLDLENDLILSLWFFSEMKKNTSGGLILYLEKFGMNLYSMFFQKIYMK